MTQVQRNASSLFQRSALWAALSLSIFGSAQALTLNRPVVQSKQGEALRAEIDISEITIAEQVEFQASLLGKSSQEVEILNAQYRIQAELEKTIQDIERQNGTLRADEFERMKSAAAEALAIQTNAIMARQEMERSASYGIERGMRSYAESAGNAAKGMESVFNGAFKGMENAMVWRATFF